MKKAKFIIIIIVFLLVISIGGTILYKNNENNLYVTKISKENIAEITGLELDNFDVIDSYSKKNNVNSSSCFKFYNELLIVKLNLNQENDDVNVIPDDFEICNTNNDLIDYINSCFQMYDIPWLNDLGDTKVTWYNRVQQFEDRNIKSSVTLYFLENQNSNDYYIILDQTDV